MADNILGLIIPGMSLIFAFAGFGLWLHKRASYYLLGYGAAALLIGSSFAVNHYAPNQDLIAVRILVGMLSMSSMIMLAWASCTRAQQKPPLMLWLSGAVFTLLALLPVNPATDISIWLYSLNAFCGIVFIMAAQLMARGRSNGFADRALVYVYAIVAVQFFVRPIAVLAIEGPMTAAEYRDSSGHAILMASSAILMLLMVATIVTAVMTDHFKTIHDDAQTDPLTNLKMRRAFEDSAADMIERGARENRSLALIIADIDLFKQVNDIWGHQAGDKAIAAFGNLIKSTIRGTDLAGRVGGEEFCILVWNCTPEAAEGLAERLRKAFAALPHEGVSECVRLTASFGVTGVIAEEGYARAFSRADQALYEAKDAGRNRVVLAGRGRRRNDQAPSAAGREEGSAISNAA